MKRKLAVFTWLCVLLVATASVVLGFGDWAGGGGGGGGTATDPNAVHISQINQPNGVAGLNGTGALSAKVAIYQDTRSNINAASTLLAGQMAYATDTFELLLGDGSTANASLANLLTSWGVGGNTGISGSTALIANYNQTDASGTTISPSGDISFDGSAPTGLTVNYRATVTGLTQHLWIWITASGAGTTNTTCTILLHASQPDIKLPAMGWASIATNTIVATGTGFISSGKTASQSGSCYLKKSSGSNYAIVVTSASCSCGFICAEISYPIDNTIH
jgi:hypothetical protein